MCCAQRPISGEMSSEIVEDIAVLVAFGRYACTTSTLEMTNVTRVWLTHRMQVVRMQFRIDLLNFLGRCFTRNRPVSVLEILVDTIRILIYTFRSTDVHQQKNNTKRMYTSTVHRIESTFHVFLPSTEKSSA